jgi:DNA-binding transcriptional LysR family regulator
MRYWYKKNKMQLLRGFCMVMEEGSILQASKKLNIAQSSVSLQITSLERDLNIPLFRRENQRLIPTDEARNFYKICKKFVDEMDFMFEHASEMIKQDYDDKIRIAAHTYMLSHILPPYFKKIVKTNPKLRFELHNTGYEETIDLLNSGNVDFAIYPAEKKNLPKNFTLYEFYKCKFAIGVGKDHPLANVHESEITWNLLAKYDFISIGKCVTTQGLKTLMKANGVDSRFRLYNGTWEISLGIIKQGLSVSGADAFYGSGHNDIVIKNCPNLIPEYKFHILLNKNIQLSKASQKFLKMLIKK